MPESRPPESPEKGFRPDMTRLTREYVALGLMVEAIDGWFAASPEPVTRETARRALQEQFTALLNRAVPLSDLKPSERLSGTSPAAGTRHKQEPAND